MTQHFTAVLMTESGQVLGTVEGTRFTIEDASKERPVGSVLFTKDAVAGALLPNQRVELLLRDGTRMTGEVMFTAHHQRAGRASVYVISNA
jgi:hypothetical protein